MRNKIDEKGVMGKEEASKGRRRRDQEGTRKGPRRDQEGTRKGPGMY